MNKTYLFIMIAYDYKISAATVSQQLMTVITHFTPLCVIQKCDVWSLYENVLSDDSFNSSSW